jgi:DNA polymerase-3 subunit epsilon
MTLPSFVAVDVETANYNRGSICQIAIVEFIDGEIVSEWSALVDPDEAFNSGNIEIHGITPEDVVGSPTIGELAGEIRKRLIGRLVVSHTMFDQEALSIALPEVANGLEWADSCEAARRAWSWMPTHRLAYLAEELGITFKHHDALEDARTAGFVMLAASQNDASAMRRSTTVRATPHQKSPRGFSAKIKSRNGNPHGTLAGEVIVMTGTMWTSRNRVATEAAAAGCNVRRELTKSTTILVVGSDSAGPSKLRKADQLIADGQQLRVMCYTEFQALLSECSSPLSV